jgi:hypothetical protein
MKTECRCPQRHLYKFQGPMSRPVDFYTPLLSGWEKCIKNYRVCKSLKNNKTGGVVRNLLIPVKAVGSRCPQR